MLKGSLANTHLPSLWVHSDVLLKDEGRRFLIGPKIKTVQHKDWLWAISYFVKPILVYIDSDINPLLKDYDSLSFVNFNECRESLYRSQRSVELVVVDPKLVCRDVVLFNKNVSRYSHGY
jgi:hypothetical protein